MKRNTREFAPTLIDRLIVEVRGHRVILDSDLAGIYSVPTKALNQAVKRNQARFPEDFLFRLSPQETEDLNRSQIVTGSQRHRDPRFPPYAFTEHGAIMAANVLNSERAAQMSVFVVRAFVKMRSALTDTRELARKLAALEGELKSRLDAHEVAIVEVLHRLMKLIDPPSSPPEPPRPEIGFHVRENASPYRINRRRKKRGLFASVLAVLALMQLRLASGQLQQEWVAHYTGPGTVTTDRNRLALDGAGNLYMAGTDIWVRYLTVKYGRNGNQLWATRYVGPGNGSYTYDVAAALAADRQGAAFVTGRSLGSIGVYDYATVKYDPNGNQVWVARYDGPVHANDHATALAVDALGQVHVTGESTGVFFDYATVKYDTNGNQLWVARYNGPGNNDDSAVAIAVDLAGNVYVTGNSVGAGTATDIATIKYSPAGEQLWVARYDGPAHSYDSAAGLVVDAVGCVYITGGSTSPGSGSDYVTVKYNPNGAPVWTARYHGPSNNSDFSAAIALDGSNNVYVTGESWGAGAALSDSSWASLWVATNAAGTVVCRDTAATNLARRFYRALKQP